MPDDSFTCAQCGRTFQKARSDEEARKEAGDLFPGRTPESMVVVCHDCFTQLVPHA